MTSLRSAYRDDPRQLVVDDVEWLVYELPLSYDRRGGHSLVFESQGAVRRVRTFPANWRELSDIDLWALSMRT